MGELTAERALELARINAMRAARCESDDLPDEYVAEYHDVAAICRAFAEQQATIEWARNHSCKPPLGNPTREEAMATIAERDRTIEELRRERDNARRRRDDLEREIDAKITYYSSTIDRLRKHIADGFVYQSPAPIILQGDEATSMARGLVASLQREREELRTALAAAERTLTQTLAAIQIVAEGGEPSFIPDSRAFDAVVTLAGRFAAAEEKLKACEQELDGYKKALSAQRVIGGAMAMVIAEITDEKDRNDSMGR